MNAEDEDVLLFTVIMESLCYIYSFTVLCHWGFTTVGSKRLSLSLSLISGCFLIVCLTFVISLAVKSNTLLRQRRLLLRVQVKEEMNLPPRGRARCLRGTYKAALNRRLRGAGAAIRHGEFKWLGSKVWQRPDPVIRGVLCVLCLLWNMTKRNIRVMIHLVQLRCNRRSLPS